MSHRFNRLLQLTTRFGVGHVVPGVSLTIKRLGLPIDVGQPAKACVDALDPAVENLGLVNHVFVQPSISEVPRVRSPCIQLAHSSAAQKPLDSRY